VLMSANRERRLPMKNQTSQNSQILIRNAALRYAMGMCLALAAWCPAGRAQANAPAPASAEEVKQLREVVQGLQTRVTELESELKQRQISSTTKTGGNPKDSNAESAATGTATATPAAAPAPSASLETAKEQLIAGDRGILDYLHGATLNFALDEYYAFNFNRPVGRVNALRAYDVLSNISA
jgi:hypothetical protein